MKIPVHEPVLSEDEINNVTEAIRSSWISSKGKFILDFEEGFASYCGVKHGVATSNGTVALHLALEGLGIGKGDEVIVPTLTFISVANAVKYTGAKPVFVDSHPVYWCMDPKKTQEKITKKTKAIILVHLYGHPCDMDKIVKIAQDHNLFVVEDAAEAHGAEYKGKKVGSFGDISCFSFYGNKIITTGEGGMCLTNNEELAKKMRILRDHGMNPEKRYWHNVIGFNYRMTNLEAAIGVAQLKKIDKIISRKRKIAKTYDSLVKNIDGIFTPPEMPWAKNVYWLYTMLMSEKFGVARDELMKELEKKGIETRPMFYPIHTMPPYKTEEKLPISEKLSKRGITLPSSAKLQDEVIIYITNSIKEIRDRYKVECV